MPSKQKNLLEGESQAQSRGTLAKEGKGSEGSHSLEKKARRSISRGEVWHSADEDKKNRVSRRKKQERVACDDQETPETTLRQQRVWERAEPETGVRYQREWDHRTRRGKRSKLGKGGDGEYKTMDLIGGRALKEEKSLWTNKKSNLLMLERKFPSRENFLSGEEEECILSAEWQGGGGVAAAQ